MMCKSTFESILVWLHVCKSVCVCVCVCVSMCECQWNVSMAAANWIGEKEKEYILSPNQRYKMRKQQRKQGGGGKTQTLTSQ